MRPDCNILKSTIRVNLLHAHGSPTQYLYRWHGCRCETCRAATAEYNASYQLKYAPAHRGEAVERAGKWERDHPEEMRVHHRNYRMKNLDQYRSYTRNRRASVQQAPGFHTAADIAAQRTRQKGKCYWCEAKVGRSYHVDHVVPITRGGSNGPENLVIACATCNESKGAKLPHEWSDRLC